MIIHKNKKISQAVILAGGQGVRLRPITDLYQKCMFRFGGRPFLYYLIKFYKRQGIKKFLILTGYKSEQIMSYFGNGKNFGVNIHYSYSPIDAQTGKRVLDSYDQLDELFFLSYADVYCNFDLKSYEVSSVFISS
jgi:NDP-sugar pyrophosphorylase family protein